MEGQADSRTKSWLYRLRYLKMFKNNNNSKGEQHQSEVPTFRRSLSTNEPTRQTNLRKSLRKWHKRMKNCFSNNNNLPQTIIHIAQESDTLQSPDTSQKENIYSEDPTIQNCPENAPDNQPRSPTISVSSLAHNVWYWGPVSKTLVESKLSGAPDGSFLVRDSASERHIFSISFRSVGQTLHARIERTNSGYKVFDHKGLETVQEMIEEAMKVSLEDGIYCYTQSRGDEPNYPVRLLHPISRYDEVRTLQSLTRFVIRQHINLNDIDKLCLPSRLIWFLKEEHYF